MRKWSPRAMIPTAIQCGGHHPPPPPALSNVGKYADGTIKWFTISQIYNKIAFSLYSSLLSIRYFELGNLEREEREKRGLDRNQARIQRGDRGSGPPPPPWDLTEVRSCVAAWWVHVGEGVQRLFSTYYYLFFLTRFARQYYTSLRITYIHTSKFNIQYGTVILSLY